MKTVELRLRERSIGRDVYDRCKAEYNRLWNQEVVTNG